MLRDTILMHALGTFEPFRERKHAKFAQQAGNHDANHLVLSSQHTYEPTRNNSSIVDLDVID